MSQLLQIFSNNILPIFLAAGSGFLIAKFMKVPPRPVSHVAFYVFSPCLIFNLLTTNHLDPAEIARMAGFTIISILCLGGLTWLLGRLLRLNRRILAAVLLTVMFSNAGNYGLSLNRFAFGETALAHASLYFAIAAILMYTLGVLIASLGTSGLRQALISLLKVPVLYAVALALLFNTFGWTLVLPLQRTVDLLGEAAIPLLMVLMGIQLQNSRFNGQTLALTLSSFMRLVAAPALALGLGLVFGLQGPALQAGITESAMPAAITTTVLATEFDVEPSFVTAVVFISTLLSPLTVTPLLALLGASR